MPSAKDLLRQYAAIKGARRSFDQHYEDLAGVMAPGRLGFTSEQSEGERRGDERFDGTPMQAARGLANATGGLLRPEGQQWFFIETEDRVEDTDKEAKDWLAAAERRQMAAMDNPKARFRRATGEADFDAAVFGSADIFVGERGDLGGLLYQAQHLKDTWVRFDDDGQPEAHFRRRWLTAPQAAAKLGEANIGERARDLLQRNDVETRLEYAHIVLRREEGREPATSPGAPGGSRSPARPRSPRAASASSPSCSSAGTPPRGRSTAAGRG